MKKRVVLIVLAVILGCAVLFAALFFALRGRVSEPVTTESGETDPYAGAAVLPEALQELVVTEAATEQGAVTEAVTETDTETPRAMTPEEAGPITTIIGDSITYLTEDRLKEALPGVEIYSAGGKILNRDNGPNPSGLSVAQTLKEVGHLREIVVFALGTNNRDSVQTDALTADMFKVLHDITEDRTVYLVTNYDLRHPETYDRNNAAIRAAAATYDDWYVIDWVETVESTGDPEKYILDEGEAAVGDMQVHPTDPEGKDLWVKTICDAVCAGTGE